MVANSKLKLKVLNSLLAASSGLPLGVHPYQVSSVHHDGTVVVRFHSINALDATTLATRVAKVLEAQGYEFRQVDDVRIVFPLSAIPE